MVRTDFPLQGADRLGEGGCPGEAGRSGSLPGPDRQGGREPRL